MRPIAQLRAIFAKGKEHARSAYGTQRDRVSRVGGNVRTVASTAPEAGRRVLRTFSVGAHHSLDRAVAGGINWAGITAENALHGRITDAAMNLSREGARTIGIAQKHATYAALDKIQRMRRGAALRTGGAHTEAEAAKIAAIRSDVHSRLGFLGEKRDLRRRSNAGYDIAAQALAAKMRTMGSLNELRHGLTNEDVTRDTILRYVSGGGENYHKHRNEVLARAEYLAKFGG